MNLKATIIAVSEHVATKIKSVAYELGYNDIDIMVNHSGVEDIYKIKKDKS